MPNKDINNKNYIVNDEIVKSVIGDNISGTNLTTIKSRLENKGELTNDEEIALKWVKNKYNSERKSIDSIKRTQMDIGRENVYKDTHTKDKGNTNVTKIGGLAKLTNSTDNKHISGGKTSDNIKNNRVQYYESLDIELTDIKYLIEYLDNNKNNNK